MGGSVLGRVSELKPCPFCGGIPSVNTGDRKVYRYTYQQESGCFVFQRIEIICKKCFCTKDILCQRKIEGNPTDRECRKVQKQMAREAIQNMWNRRVE